MPTGMLSVQQTATGLELRIAATLPNIDEADQVVSDFLAARASQADLFAIRILLREALLNAVTHGCGEDPGQVITLELDLDASGITLAVADEGEGFDWRARSGALDVLGDGGRGLPLLRFYSSHVDFNAAGNRVVLRRDFTPASQKQQTVGGGSA